MEQQQKKRDGPGNKRKMFYEHTVHTRTSAKPYMWSRFVTTIDRAFTMLLLLLLFIGRCLWCKKITQYHCMDHITDVLTGRHVD